MRSRRNHGGEHQIVLFFSLTADTLLKLTLQQTTNKREKLRLFFRTDWPVLIIAATWHEATTPYGRSLRDHLLRTYAGNEDLVSVQPQS